MKGLLKKHEDTSREVLTRGDEGKLGAFMERFLEPNPPFVQRVANSQTIGKKETQMFL